MTYVKLLRMVNSRSRAAQQRRKLRQSKRKKRSWKVALRRFTWWVFCQWRRIRALGSAVEYAVSYSVKPLSTIPMRTSRWAKPHTKWAYNWFIAPIVNQFSGIRTQHSDPELVKWGSNFHKVLVGNKVKPNPPEWAKAPRRKKSGGMRPSRWRSYWVVRAQEHERQADTLSSGHLDYGPFPLSPGEDDVEEELNDGWWPFS